MTLEETIYDFEQVINEEYAKIERTRQLAEWFRELKKLRETVKKYKKSYNKGFDDGVRALEANLELCAEEMEQEKLPENITKVSEVSMKLIKETAKEAENEDKSCSNCKYWLLDENDENRKCKYCFQMDEWVAKSEGRYEKYRNTEIKGFSSAYLNACDLKLLPNIDGTWITIQDNVGTSMTIKLSDLSDFICLNKGVDKAESEE